MKKLILSAALVAVSLTSFAQIGVGTNAPDASAELDVTSTDKGFLMPRMADHTVISSPAEGLQVYNTTTDKVMLFDGTVWVAGATGSGKFVDGTDPLDAVYMDGFVGIGTTVPGSHLTILNDASTSSTNQAKIDVISENMTNTWETAKLTLSSYRGTGDVPTEHLINDYLGEIQMSGIQAGSAIRTKADEAHTSTTRGTRLEFHTTLNGTTGIKEAMRISGDGFVGIGTTVPGSHLTILNDASTSSTNQAKIDVISENMTNTWETAKLTLSSYRGTGDVPTEHLINDYLGEIQMSGIQAGSAIRTKADEAHTSTTRGTRLEFHTTKNGTTGLQEVMRVAGNGNIGIGTTSPTSALDVFGTTKITGKINAAGFTLKRGIATSGSEFLGIINFSDVDNNTGARIIGAGNPVNNQTALSFMTGADLVNVKMKLDSNGNLGIGNSSPGARLDVSGYIKLGSTDVVADVVPSAGMMRYNSTSDTFEGYVNDDGSGSAGWVALH